MKCDKCGTDLEFDNAKFCPECGAPLPKTCVTEGVDKIAPETSIENETCKDDAIGRSGETDSISFKVGKTIGRISFVAKSARENFQSAFDEVEENTDAAQFREPSPMSAQKSVPNMKFVLTAVVILALLLSICFGVSVFKGLLSEEDPSSSALDVVVPEPEYDVDVHVVCNENLFFSRYKVDVYLDYEKIGTVDHGAINDFTYRLPAGEHTLKLESAEDMEVTGSRNFTVGDEAVTINCEITCNDDQVTIKEFELKTTSQLIEDEATSETGMQEEAEKEPGEEARQEATERADVEQIADEKAEKDR